MDYRKLDSALASQIETAAPASKLNVFIHTAGPVTKSQARDFVALGGAASPQPGEIFTAVVPVESLGGVSELPWVTRIVLAKKLKPLKRAGGT